MHPRALFSLLALLGPAARATSILLPLYVYPSWEGWWDNVYAAIAANPTATFQVILNPDNGPGGGNGNAAATPGYNIDWVAGVARLNAYPNVQTLGYAHTSYGARDAADVDADVAAWAAWNTYAGPENIAVHGIFFDEVPNWTGRKGRADVHYMAAREAHARAQFNVSSWRPDFSSSSRWRGRGDKNSHSHSRPPAPSSSFSFQTVFNVGTQVVHPEYFAQADSVVVYENYASAYASDADSVLRNNVPAGLAARSSILLHDFVSASLPAGDVEAWLRSWVDAGLGSADILDYGYDQANTADAPADIGSVASILSS